MAEYKLSSATSSNLTDNVEAYAVAPKNTESAQNQKETQWINAKWPQYFGYYKKIPELKKAIDMKAIWTLGNGYEADSMTTVILDHITGWGQDTFNTILKNMVITMQINGDAYAEIIKDADTGNLINLKPLDPGSIKIIAGRDGRIIRYEQINKSDKENVYPTIFQPEDIFHLSNDRVADEIHGVSIIEACEDIILARNEAIANTKTIMRHWAKPMMKFELDTDDQTKINEYILKMDKAVAAGENIYIPKGVVTHELIALPSNATLNTLPWIQYLETFFFKAVGIPAILFGGASEFTESTAKIAYLAFEQPVKAWQLDIEEQIWNQLFLRIQLTFPASLQNELISDQNKDSTGNFQPSDTTAGVGQ